MEDQTNQIELIGNKRTRPTLSFVRHLLDKWVERQQSKLFYPDSSVYHAVIFRDEGSLLFTCELQKLRSH